MVSKDQLLGLNCNASSGYTTKVLTRSLKVVGSNPILDSDFFEREKKRS